MRTAMKVYGGCLPAAWCAWSSRAFEKGSRGCAACVHHTEPAYLAFSLTSMTPEIFSSLSYACIAQALHRNLINSLILRLDAAAAYGAGVRSWCKQYMMAYDLNTHSTME